MLDHQYIKEALNISTHYDYPPIPIRDFDWSAVFDDTYEPGDYMGTGRTEADAIEDLIYLVEGDS